MIQIVGLTRMGTIIASNPHNPNDADHRVLAFLFKNNNQANKDTVCQYVFNGDQATCNVVLGGLKRQRLIAYDIGN